MSETADIPIPGSKIKLTKYPPNRFVMDWDRVLHINQVGEINRLSYDGKADPLYAVWFIARDGKSGHEVWLAAEHFKLDK